MSFARGTYTKKEQEMVRGLFFHVIDDATNELFTDSWTKRTTKEKTGDAMLDARRCIWTTTSRSSKAVAAPRTKTWLRRSQSAWKRREERRPDPQQMRPLRPHLLVRHLLRLLFFAVCSRAIGWWMPGDGPRSPRRRETMATDGSAEEA